MNHELQNRRIFKLFELLEVFLNENIYMASDMLTIADIALLATVESLDLYLPLETVKKKLPKLYASFQNVRELPMHEASLNGLKMQRKILENYGKFKSSDENRKSMTRNEIDDSKRAMESSTCKCKNNNFERKSQRLLTGVIGLKCKINKPKTQEKSCHFSIKVNCGNDDESIDNKGYENQLERQSIHPSEPQQERKSIQPSEPQQNRKSIRTSVPQQERKSIQPSETQEERKSIQPSEPQQERKSIQRSEPQQERKSNQPSEPEEERISIQSPPPQVEQVEAQKEKTTFQKASPQQKGKASRADGKTISKRDGQPERKSFRKSDPLRASKIAQKSMAQKERKTFNRNEPQQERKSNTKEVNAGKTSANVNGLRKETYQNASNKKEVNSVPEKDRKQSAKELCQCEPFTIKSPCEDNSISNKKETMNKLGHGSVKENKVETKIQTKIGISQKKSNGEKNEKNNSTKMPKELTPPKKIHEIRADTEQNVTINNNNNVDLNEFYQSEAALVTCVSVFSTIMFKEISCESSSIDDYTTQIQAEKISERINSNIIAEERRSTPERNSKKTTKEQTLTKRESLVACNSCLYADSVLTVNSSVMVMCKFDDDLSIEDGSATESSNDSYEISDGEEEQQQEDYVVEDESMEGLCDKCVGCNLNIDISVANFCGKSCNNATNNVEQNYRKLDIKLRTCGDKENNYPSKKRHKNSNNTH